MTIPRLDYPWRRFLIPRGEAARLDDGFLVDPDRLYGRAYNRPVVSTGAALEVACLVILGEPGVGKTAVLNELRRESARHRGSTQDTMSIELNAYSSDSLLHRNLFESVQFQEWLSSTKTLDLFLDGLDESLIHIRTVATFLAHEFVKYPTSRLRLRIACRTAEWPALLRDRLQKLWNSYEEHEVAPLRRTDVELAAALTVSKPHDFVQEIQRRGLGALAAKPLTLQFLLEAFASGGQLPTRLSDLYERGCLLLCSEANPSRTAAGLTATVDPEHILHIAERIAAVTMFCKRSSVIVDDRASLLRGADEIGLPDLVGPDRIGSRQFNVTREDVLAALRSGLFRSGGDSNRLTWGHWSYAEFLAARYATTRSLTTQQQISLLAQTDADSSIRITPQLQETAAWLASMNSDLVTGIVRTDPQVLLRSEMDSSIRPALTASLLSLFDQEELTDFDLDLRHRYGVLRHAGLDAQLRPYITDRSKGFLVRRVAIDIAESAGADSLLPNLVAIALGSAEPLEVRIQAAYAVNRLDVRQFKQQLRPLLDIPREEDPQLELFGNALRALWPADLSAGEVFARLRQRHEHFVGAHAMFMSHYLIEGLAPSDLPTALRWVEQQPPEHENTFEFSRLVDDILGKAWQHLENPHVLNAFADAAIARLDKYDHVPSERVLRDPENTIDWTNAWKRHALLSTIVPKICGRLDSASSLLVADTHLLAADDLPWLLAQVAAAQDSREVDLWASLAALVFRWIDDPEQVSLVLKASASSPALQREMAPLVGPIALDSAEAEALRTRHNRARERVEERKRRVSHPPLPAIVASWLQQFESGDVSAWWRLTLDMTLTNDSDRYPPQAELNPDLTDLPAWQELDDSTKSRLIDAAAVYIAKGDPNTAEWLGTNTFHRPATAGYKAIRLLLSARPSALDSIAAAEWKKWAPTVLAYPESPDVEAQKPASAVLCRTYAEAPAEIIDTARVLLDKDAEQGNAYILHRFDDCWDDRLAVAVLEHVKSLSEYPPGALQQVLDYVLQRPLEAGRDYALDLISTTSVHDDLAQRRRIAAATALMRVDARRAWPVVWPFAQSDTAFGRALFLHFATHTESRRGSFLQELPEEFLGDLYEWLSLEFPHKDDPRASGFVGDRHNVAMFRDALLEVLKQRGTTASVSTIRSLAHRLPELSWLRFVAIEARRVQLRRDWEALSPPELFKLASDERSRLIMSGSQLLDAVLDSLRTLDRRLQGETAGVFALWDEISKRPKIEERLSDYIKNHLDDDLRRRGVVVNREVEVKKGNETDIHVSAIKPLPDGGYDVLKAIVEVKGCWHPNLRKAMKEQLIDRYLVGTGNEYGLYVVGWFLCDEWDSLDNRKGQTPKWDIDTARERFDEQSRQLSTGGIDVRSFVLDTRLQ